MSMIYDKLNINVVDGSVSILPDFYQTTQNSHCLLIHLRKGCDKRNFFKIDGLTPEIHFTNAQGEEVVSEAVNIDNPYRGDLSYVIGPAMLKDQNRYVVSLVFTNADGEKIYKFQFIINVVKDYNKPQEDSDVEVTIKKSEKKQWEEAVEEALALEGRVEDLEKGNTKVLYPNPEDPRSPIEFNIPSTDDSPESELDFTQFTTWEFGQGESAVQTRNTDCRAKGDYSVAEGLMSHAGVVDNDNNVDQQLIELPNNDQLNMEGWNEARGAHAEGGNTYALGDYAHTEGNSTVANNPYEHAQGVFNISHMGHQGVYPSADNTIHSIGIGSNLSNRKNAEETMENGDKYIIGLGGFNGTNPNEADTVQDVINGKVDTDDIVDNAESEDPNIPLSANMGRELNQRIDNLAGRGRFLSTWDCTTGLADTLPTTDPYEYKPGDYFIVSTIATEDGQVNYRPFGTEYSVSTPSTDVETEDVKPNDDYWFDGTVWILQKNTVPELVYDDELSNTSENAVQNKVIKKYLDDNYSKDLKGEILYIYFDPTTETSGTGLSSDSPVKTSQEVWNLVNQYNGDFVINGANTSKQNPLHLAENLSNKNVRFNTITIEVSSQCHLSNSNIYIGYQSILFRTEDNSIGCTGDCSITLGNDASIEDTAATRYDSDCMILGETGTPNSNEVPTNIIFTTQAPSNYIYSNSNCLISSYGNGSLVCNINDFTNGTIKTLCEVGPAYSCVINVFGNPDITKDSWTTNDKYAVINYAGDSGIIPIVLDFEYDSKTIITSYTYNQIYDMVGDLGDGINRLPVLWLNRVDTEYGTGKMGPFICFQNSFDKNQTEGDKPNKIYFMRPYESPDNEYGYLGYYGDCVSIDKQNNWTYSITINSAMYASRIGSHYNHSQIGATNKPVYVNSNGQIVAGDTINNGTTYLYRRDGKSTTRYVGAWTANATGTSTLYLDDYDLNGGYITIYIDSRGGSYSSDSWSGTSSSFPIQTWGKLVELINRYYNGKVIVRVKYGPIQTTVTSDIRCKDLEIVGGEIDFYHNVYFEDCNIFVYDFGELRRKSSSGQIVCSGRTNIVFGYHSSITSNITENLSSGSSRFIHFQDSSSISNVSICSPGFSVNNGSGGPYAGQAVFGSYNGSVNIRIASGSPDSGEAVDINCSNALLSIDDYYCTPSTITIDGYENFNRIKYKHLSINNSTGELSKSCKIEFLGRDLKGGTANVYLNSTLLDSSNPDLNSGLSSSAAVKSWWKLLEILQTYKNGKVIVNITGTLDMNIANQNVQLDNIDLEFVGNVTVSTNTYFHNVNITYHAGTWLSSSITYLMNCSFTAYSCTLDDDGESENQPRFTVIGSRVYLGQDTSWCSLVSTNSYGLFYCSGLSSEFYLQLVDGTINYLCDYTGGSSIKYGPVIYVYNDAITKTGYIDSGDSNGIIIYNGPHTSIPQVTSADNGKFLQVVDGQWSAVSLPVYNGEVE